VFLGAFSPVTGEARLVLAVCLEKRGADELADESSSSPGLFLGLMKPNSSLFELDLVDEELQHGVWFHVEMLDPEPEYLSNEVWSLMVSE
jgi:hypothetical protein